MAKFRFQRHGRIQEAVAEELGFFREVGLDYELAPHRSHGHKVALGYERLIANSLALEPSAYRDFVLGGAVSNIASTSYWAVSVAVQSGYGRLWTSAYSIMPAGLYVGPDRAAKSVADLAGHEIVVGRHSGSHFAALHALQRVGGPAMKLHFIEGRMKRLNYLLEHPAAAGSMYGVDAYILESRGYRKVLDSTFMVAFMIVGSPPEQDVEKYFQALHLAQRAIDADPGLYVHYLLLDFPDSAKASFDARAFGIGERLIFDAPPPDLLSRAKRWVGEQTILPEPWLD